MSATHASWWLVLDDRFRDELVMHREHSRCAATELGVRCQRTATYVMWLPRPLDLRDLRAYAASCAQHATSLTLRPTDGAVPVR